MSGEPQELEIVIAEDGEVRVEVIGAKGGRGYLHVRSQVAYWGL